MPGLKNLPIAGKIALLVLLSLLSFISFAWFSHNTLQELKVTGPVYQEVVNGKDIVADLVPPPLCVLEPFCLAHIAEDASDPVQLAEILTKFELLEKLSLERAQYWAKVLPDIPIRSELVGPVKDSEAAFYKILNEQFIPKLKAKDNEGMSVVTSGPLQDAYKAQLAAVEKAVQVANKYVELLDQESTSKLASRGFATQGFAIGAGLAIVTLGVIIGRSLIKPVHKLVDAMEDIAHGEGDLTKRVAVSSSDEVGKLGSAFNMFIEKIAKTIQRVDVAAGKLASTSATLAASSQQVSAGLTSQSQQVTQVAAAVEEMSASINEVASKTSETSRAATDAGTIAEAGGNVVAQTVLDIQLISEAVNTSAQLVTQLGQRGDQIGQIIKVINDIAEQTNLLALNAAIEAARAGEHGRGFAVVADEVRKLADRTTKATEEIGVSIKAIQSETVQAVEKMTVGTAQVDRGVQRATEAGTNLTKIVENSRNVASMVQTIAAAAEEQGAVSTEISKSIESISSTTIQAAEGGRIAADAAQQVAAFSEELRSLVGAFKIEHSDGSSGKAHTPTPPSAEAPPKRISKPGKAAA